MNRGDFLSYLSNPTNVSPDAGRDLESILDLYPYFQGAHILYALTLNSNNDIRFNEALRNAALHTGNRKVLFQFLHESPQTKTIEKEAEPEITLTATEEENSKVDTNSDPEDELKREDEIEEQVEIAPIQEQTETDKQDAQEEKPKTFITQETPIPLIGKHSFSDWLKTIQTKKTNPEMEASVTANERADYNVVDKEELIEKFIKTEPRISKPAKAEFFSPIIMAKKSVEDSDDIVSETLAKIYAEQGNPSRAIRIYQKLSLLNPDKSGYFAALIQKLENPDLL